MVEHSPQILAREEKAVTPSGTSGVGVTLLHPSRMLEQIKRGQTTAGQPRLELGGIGTLTVMDCRETCSQRKQLYVS